MKDGCMAAKIRRVFALAMMLVFFSSSLCLAELITVFVTGTVTSTRPSSEFFPEGSVLNGIGTSMTGYCTYDTDIQDWSNSPDWGSYDIESLSMTIGNFTFIDNFSRHTIAPDAPYLTAHTWNNNLIYRAGGPKAMVFVDDIFQDYSAGVVLFDLWYPANVVDETIPLPFPDMTLLGNKQFGAFFPYPGGVDGIDEIRGVIDSITIIPEPATLLLFGIGSLLLRKCKG